MSKIHALDHQTGALLGTLDNLGDRLFWGDTYIRELGGEHSFEFYMPSTIKESAFFYGRSRFLIERDLGEYEEFMVYLCETDGDTKYIKAIASYADMDRDFVIGAGSYSGTIKELSALVLYPNAAYRQRIVEYANIRTITLDRPVGAYDFLSRLMNLFDMEMDFFVKVNGSAVEARYVDIVTKLGQDRGKLVEMGRDLIALDVKENSENIYSALICMGPEREDGTFLQTTIVDGDAFQRWNFEGRHRIGIYAPESDDTEMTLTELEQYGRTELNKRIASVFEYDIEVASIGSPMYFGDRIRVKDPSFNPPFYATSRVIRIEKAISSKDVRAVRLGEVVTYTEEEVTKAWNRLFASFIARLAEVKNSKNAVKRQATKPDMTNAVQGDTWLKEDEGNTIYTYNAILGDYEPALLDYQALSVGELSAISANLGTVIAGDLYGINIYGALITSGSEINVTTDLNVGQNIYLGNGLTTDVDRYIRFGGTANFAGINLSQDIRGSARIFYTNPDGETWLGDSRFNAEPVTDAVEVGYCAFQAAKGSVATIGATGVNFRIKKNYVPSSVTLTKIDGNAESVAINDLTEDGFLLIVISAGASTGESVGWRGNYSA